jgi:hypothetical protein
MPDSGRGELSVLTPGDAAQREVSRPAISTSPSTAGPGASAPAARSPASGPDGRSPTRTPGSWPSSSGYGRDKARGPVAGLDRSDLNFRLGRRQPLPGVDVTIRVGDGDRHVGGPALTALCAGCGCEVTTGRMSRPCGQGECIKGPLWRLCVDVGRRSAPGLRKTMTRDHFLRDHFL